MRKYIVLTILMTACNPPRVQKCVCTSTESLDKAFQLASVSGGGWAVHCTAIACTEQEPKP